MKIALATNMGSFVEKYQLDFGPDWKVVFTK